MGAVLVVVLAGCASEDVATCAQFASMSPDTGLMSDMSDGQRRALQVSLDAAGYDDGDYNVSIGWTEVLAFCNIYDGVANANQSEPISEAH